MSDEKILDNEPLEEMELSDDELTEASGGVMIKPSQRYRATCGECGYVWYPLIALGQRPVVGCLLYGGRRGGGVTPAPRRLICAACSGPLAPNSHVV